MKRNENMEYLECIEVLDNSLSKKKESVKKKYHGYKAIASTRDYI